MTALAMASLDPLFDACREGQVQYAEAARTVGDPGLKLQFNHIAAGRAGIIGEIAAVLGLKPPVTAEQKRPSSVSSKGRLVLGGEDRSGSLSGAELALLVRRLREHDELTLNQMRQHVDAIPCIATVQVLERAMGVLAEDLRKISILETLASEQAPR